jgi:hypothetical protein
MRAVRRHEAENGCREHYEITRAGTHAIDAF